MNRGIVGFSGFGQDTPGGGLTLPGDYTPVSLTDLQKVQESVDSNRLIAFAGAGLGAAALLLTLLKK